MTSLPTRGVAPARPRRRRALAGAVLTVAIAAVALPSAAEAGTVARPTPTIVGFEGALGERNVVRVSTAPNGDVVFSDTLPITLAPNSGCRSLNSREVACPGVEESVLVFLRDGDDVSRYEARQPGGVFGGDGNDAFVAGLQPVGSVFYSGDDRRDRDGRDHISYAETNRGVSVNPDGLANDGRAGDSDHVSGDIEQFTGSQFRDTLLGTPEADIIAGFGDRDIIAGGAGDDVFSSPVKDGADDYHGGPGRDRVDYSARTQPLNITLDNVANDGETNGRFTVEGDLVRSNVEDIVGGSGADKLSSFSAFSRLEGGGGADSLLGGDGPDTLIGGPGGDSLEAGGGNDVVDARDGEPDFVDCGTESDTLSRDVAEGILRGCETVAVGVLQLAARAIDATVGEPAALTLSWRHPGGWRKLRTVTLRLLRDGAAVGEITIRPRSERIESDGVVEVARRATRVTRQGKTVTARLALRIDDSMAGQKLGLEVEATDKQGRRQLERDAGSIRVAP